MTWEYVSSLFQQPQQTRLHFKYLQRFSHTHLPHRNVMTEVEIILSHPVTITHSRPKVFLWFHKSSKKNHTVLLHLIFMATHTMPSSATTWLSATLISFWSFSLKKKRSLSSWQILCVVAAAPIEKCEWGSFSHSGSSRPRGAVGTSREVCLQRWRHLPDPSGTAPGRTAAKY